MILKFIVSYFYFIVQAITLPDKPALSTLHNPNPVVIGTLFVWVNNGIHPFFSSLYLTDMNYKILLPFSWSFCALGISLNAQGFLQCPQENLEDNVAPSLA